MESSVKPDCISRSVSMSTILVASSSKIIGGFFRIALAIAIFEGVNISLVAEELGDLPFGVRHRKVLPHARRLLKDSHLEN